MNIAKKLVTIAENEHKVFQAGQMSVMSTSEVFKGNVSGNAVKITDITPIEHNVGVELSGNITNFGGVKITAHGKNLFDKKAWIAYCNSGMGSRGVLDDQYLGEKCFSFIPWKKSGTEWNYYGIKFKNGVQYTISMEYSFSDSNPEEHSLSLPLLAVFYTDGTSQSIGRALKNTAFGECTAKTTAGKTVKSIAPSTYGGGVTVYCKYIQIEEGATATAIEEGTESIKYTANADGTVEGVKSIYPTMIIETDTEGVLISAQYYKDIDKVFENLAINVALSGGE
jgi:hypothetical protein